MNTRNFPATPYKGLKSFSEKDAPFFFGRDDLCDIIVSNFISSRLTVIYGASGVGKSSVVDAGVAHRLKRLAKTNLYERGTPGLAVVVFRNWHDDPIAGLSASIRESVRDRFKIELSQPASTLTESVQAWTEQLEGDLLVILDQFEDYFLYHAGERGEGTFPFEFMRLVNSSGLRINFLISIREDAYTKLDCFKDEISNIFDDSIPVRHLGRDAARQAIDKPIERYNLFYAAGRQRLSIEPELVEAVLDQVQTERILASDVGGGMIKTSAATLAEAGIETAFLQLVMKRLWEMEIGTGSTTIRLKTLDDLAVNNLKGAHTIVREHLLSAMNSLGEGEQDIAARVFYHLVTPARTKIAYTCSDLAESESLDRELLTPLLNKLSNGDDRILRCSSSPASSGEPYYEIFHDVLVPAILEWRRQRVIEQKARKERAEATRQIEEHRQRAEERARIARVRLFLIVGLAVMFLLASLAAAWALIERQTAVNLRNQAVDLRNNIEAANVFNYSLRTTLYESMGEDNLKTSIGPLKEQLALYRSEPDPAILGPLLNDLAGQSTLLGQYSKGREDYSEARRYYGEAEQYALEARNILSQYLNEDDSYVAITLNELAVIYYAQAKLAEAEPLLRRSLEIMEKSTRPDNFYLLIYIENLSAYSRVMGKYADAEELSQRALSIREKSLASKPPEIAEGIKNLAEVYLDQKRYDEAEPLFNRALAILNKDKKKNQSQIALTLNGLARIYRVQGKYSDAERLFKQQLEIDTNVESEDSFKVAYDNGYLGQLYLEMGRYKEAEALLTKAVTKLENSMGMDYVLGAFPRRYLSIVRYKLNRYAEAEEGFAKALSILETTFAGNHPWVIETLQDYATFLESYAAFLHNGNRQAKAAEKEAQAKEIRDRLSSTDGRK